LRNLTKFIQQAKKKQKAEGHSKDNAKKKQAKGSDMQKKKASLLRGNNKNHGKTGKFVVQQIAAMAAARSTAPDK